MQHLILSLSLSAVPPKDPSTSSSTNSPPRVPGHPRRRTLMRQDRHRLSKHRHDQNYDLTDDLHFTAQAMQSVIREWY